MEGKEDSQSINDLSSGLDRMFANMTGEKYKKNKENQQKLINFTKKFSDEQEIFKSIHLKPELKPPTQKKRAAPQTVPQANQQFDDYIEYEKNKEDELTALSTNLQTFNTKMTIDFDNFLHDYRQ